MIVVAEMYHTILCVRCKAQYLTHSIHMKYEFQMMSSGKTFRSRNKKDSGFLD